MERIVTLHIEKLSDGAYLATSDDLHGLVVQGRTIQETVEIAHDAAQKLIGLQGDGCGAVACPPAKESFDYPLIVNT